MLLAHGAGDREALDALLPLVYDELRRIAARYLGRERVDHTLQPTALVHEAYLRLIDQHSVDWRNRAQFFGLAANMMRRILVNHAEARRAAKRDGAKIPIDDLTVFCAEQDLDLLALDEALEQLAATDKDKATVVEMKFFGGLSTAEIADVTGRSARSVERDWTIARGLLFRTLTEASYE
jgi:RNA polymerase sigma factor (TIGR02999 family)